MHTGLLPRPLTHGMSPRGSSPHGAPLLPWQFLFERVEGVSRATIVDLDAHQVSALRGQGLRGPLLQDPSMVPTSTPSCCPALRVSGWKWGSSFLPLPLTAQQGGLFCQT